jgi:hypothetical protein
MTGGARDRMQARRWWGLILASLPFFACVHPDDARIRLSFDAPRGSRAVEKVTVYFGGSKSSWPSLAPGESVSVVLSPEGDLPVLSMTYWLGSAPRTWNGPSPTRGQGYAISIHIGKDARVTERHCTMPCRPE